MLYNFLYIANHLDAIDIVSTESLTIAQWLGHFSERLSQWDIFLKVLKTFFLKAEVAVKGVKIKVYTPKSA